MKYYKLFIFLLIFGVIRSAFTAVEKPGLVVTFIDVGQGDAIYIGNKRDLNILIDTGPNNDALDYLGRLSLFPSCNLTQVFLTHPHEDHIAGLMGIMDYCKIDRLTFNDVSVPNKEWEVLTSKLRGTNVNIPDYSMTSSHSVGAGDVFEYGDIKLHVLWPPKGADLEKMSKNPNDLSLVILLDYKDKEFLFTGDAEISVLRQINWTTIAPFVDGDLDVFKIGHHGSKKSIDDALLNQLDPAVCVVSVGMPNKYGHPSQAALETMIENGCEIKRTDVDGSIEFALE